MRGWQIKLIALALSVLLPFGGYYTGKLVAQNSCVAKETVKVLQSELKGRKNADQVDKDVERLDDTELDRAYLNWVR